MFKNETKFIFCLVLAALNMLFTVLAFRLGQPVGMNVLAMIVSLLGACVYWILDGWEAPKK